MNSYIFFSFLPSPLAFSRNHFLSPPSYRPEARLKWVVSDVDRKCYLHLCTSDVIGLDSLLYGC